MIALGAGTGENFGHYEHRVSELVAGEPEDYLRERAQQNARSPPVPLHYGR